MRPIENPSPSTIRSKVDVGDDVHVVTKNGNSYELEITQVSEDAIHGTTPQGKRYKVPFAVIEAIEVSEVSGAKISGGILLTLVALIGLGWYAWDEMADEEDN